MSVITTQDQRKAFALLLAWVLLHVRADVLSLRGRVARDFPHLFSVPHCDSQRRGLRVGLRPCTRHGRIIECHLRYGIRVRQQNGVLLRAFAP